MQTYRPLNPSVQVRIDHHLVRSHVAAHRRLRRKLGPEAPTLEQLIARELTHRTPSQLVEAYLADRSPRPRRGSLELLQDGKPADFD